MKTKYKTHNKSFSVEIKYSLYGMAISVLLLSCGKSTNTYDATGSFEATEVIVSAETSGKILNFYVEEGQLLTEYQQIGDIDSIQLVLREKQIGASKKGLQSRRPNIQKQIAALLQQIVTAKTEKKRVENLVTANAANQKQLDDIVAQLAVLEKQLEAQKSTLELTNSGITDDSEALQIQVAQIKDQLQKCKIISPIKGTVLVKYTEKGEVTMPGKALFKIADVDHMILRAYITSGQLSQLKIGQKVKVSADFGEEKTRDYTGTLAWISSKSEFTPKTIETRDERANLVYAIKVNVKNDGYLKIGMYGNVKFD